MAEWKKVSQEHEAFVASVMVDFPEAEPKKMFGCTVYFLNGNMLTGCHQEEVFLRLSAADQEEILAKTAAVHFSPKIGMVMREYVALPSSIYNSPNEFRYWLRRSIDYTSALPPKEPKEKKRKKSVTQ